MPVMRVLALTCVALAPLVVQAQGFADRTDLHKAPSSSNRSSSKPTSSPPTQHHREPDRPRQQHTPPPPRQAEQSRQMQREREREMQVERARQHREHQRELLFERERGERERREATQLRREREREARFERERQQRERERELRTGVVTSPPRTPEAPHRSANPPADVVRQPVAVPATAQARAVVCRAAPVCTQPGRSCRPVEWHYTGADAIGSHRRDIARLCEVANTPDPCDCVSQCARAASCAF